MNSPRPDDTVPPKVAPAEFPAGSAERHPVEALAEEYLDRRRAGEAVTIQNYVDQYPELAADIRTLFPAMTAMENLKDHHRTSGSRNSLTLELDTELGDFRLIRELGRGGMGVVYEAVQQSLARQVALKVMPRSVLGESEHVRRFHREAQTAARLHHTNIVPVYGVGLERDLHFYAMQKIDGISLDRLISEALGNTCCLTEEDPLCVTVIEGDVTPLEPIPADNRPSAHTGGTLPLVRPSASSPLLQTLRDDLLAAEEEKNFLSDSDVAGIGIQVADALSYAHRQGVLHRDIKPGNLLLDPAGTVWITDFGLATPPTEEPAARHEVVGTIRFMAPEQFEGRHDARTDIYSLGLTLFELLTLTPAFEYSGRRRTIQAIRHGLPRRPRALRPAIDRDLEAIVLKACSVDPEQRYESAELLADDLRRFLQKRPVRARRAGALRRGWQAARRNPVVALLATAMLLVTVVSFAVVSLNWRRAVSEHHRAEDNLSLALESMNDMLQRFQSDWMSRPVSLPAGNGQSGETLLPAVADLDFDAAVHRDALKFYERFANQNPSNERLALDTARVHRRVGEIYQRKGRYSDAEKAFLRALKLFQGLERKDQQIHLETAETITQLGLTLQSASRFADAVLQFRRSEALLRDSPAFRQPAWQVAAARASSNCGRSLWLLRRDREAHRCFQQSIQWLEHLVQESPEPEYRLALARSLQGYARLPTDRRRHGWNRTARDRAVAILEAMVAEFPAVPDYQCELSENLLTGLPSLAAQQRSDRLDRALKIAEQLCQQHPAIPRYRMALANALQQASQYADEKDAQSADELAAESRRLYRLLIQESPTTPAYRILLAMALQSQANRLHQRGDTSAARQLIDEAIRHQQQYVQLRPQNPLGHSVMEFLQRDQRRIRNQQQPT